MAIYHLEARPITRSQGHQAVKAAAYRAGEKLRDVAAQRSYDYRNRRGVLSTEIITPEDAPGWMKESDRERLWNEVEKADKRKDAQLAKEYILALPRELTEEQNKNLVRSWVKENFTRRGLIADIAIHESDATDGGRNDHSHILVATRQVKGKGFGAKCRDLDKKETLRDLRAAWADAVNEALETAGHDGKIDHRTLAAQGIDRLPTAHLGKAAAAIEREGRNSQRGDQRRGIEFNNRLRACIRSASDDDDYQEGQARRKASLPFPVSTVVSPERKPLSWAQKEESRGHPGKALEVA